MRSSVCAATLAALCTLPAVGQVAKATTSASPTDVSIGSPLALTFYVAPKHPKEAETKAQSIQTPGSSDYHQFLSVTQFVKNYAYGDKELNDIEGYLQNLGFTISYVYPNHLAIEVLGTVGTAEDALQVKLQKVTVHGKSGYAANKQFTLPSGLEGKIRGIGGLNNINTPRAKHVVQSITGKSTFRPLSGALVGGTPGDYLPADFAKFYNVKALYNQGLSGTGTTVGIVTLNDFQPADAYAFWSGIGLSVSQTRITKVDVDGGIEAPSNNTGGEGETDIDTEYSGALAPGANLRVYIAPNDTNYGFTNGFEAAASENIADTLSTSWGEPELFYFASVNPTTSSDTAILDAFHDVFLEMALQGQTLYVAAGDSGAFDTVRDCSPFGTPSATTPVCNAPYAIDSPSDDPLVTAAGGTTLPFNETFRSGLNLYVNKERAWSWDYITIEAAEEGFDIPLSETFSVGGGGGVSSYFKTPWYQTGVTGITKTQPGQIFAEDTGTRAGAVAEVILPANFAGRNTPDISTNADPETGYQFIEEGQVGDGEGGTSFVAPQLNGVTALFVQALGGRVGQISPALYQLGSPTSTQLNAGNNWGYQAVKGYDNASGIGTLDANKLLTGLQGLKSK